MMGQTMTDFEHLGEAQEKAQRRRFWKVLGVMMLVAAPVGGVVGFSAGRSMGEGADLPAALAAIPPALYIVSAIVIAASLTIGTWKFVKVIDEVELADNLWGSAAGFYFYSLALPCWWLLYLGKVLPQPNDFVLYISTLVAGTAVYLVRKLRG